MGSEHRTVSFVYTPPFDLIPSLAPRTYPCLELPPPVFDGGERNHDQKRPGESIDRVDVLQHRDYLDCFAQPLPCKLKREEEEKGWSGFGLSARKENGGRRGDCKYREEE